MTHELRFLERVRQHISSMLHAPLSVVGLYAERSTPRDQYAFTVPMRYELFEATLHREGFVRNLVSSLKRREYAAPEEYTVASWVRYPKGPLRSDYQLHLSLYVGPDRDTTDVYAHWEPSWIRHPIRHYRAQEVESVEGVQRIRESLSQADIDYVVKSVEERFEPETTT